MEKKGLVFTICKEHGADFALNLSSKDSVKNLFEEIEAREKLQPGQVKFKLFYKENESIKEVVDSVETIPLSQVFDCNITKHEIAMMYPTARAGVSDSSKFQTWFKHQPPHKDIQNLKSHTPKQPQKGNSRYVHKPTSQGPMVNFRKAESNARMGWFLSAACRPKNGILTLNMSLSKNP